MNKTIIALILFFSTPLFAQESNYNRIKDMQNMKEDTNKVNLQLEIARAYIYNIPDSAYFYAQGALELSKELKNDSKIGESYMVLGSTNVVIGDFKTAVEMYQNSNVHFEKANNKKGMSGALMGLGIIYGYQNVYVPSLDYYHQSIKLAEEISDTARLSQLYNNICLIYQRTGEYDRAISYYSKSIQLSLSIGDTLGNASAYGNMGLLYIETNKLDSAKYYLDKSQELNIASNDKQGIAKNYANMSMMYEKLGDMDSAYLYLDKAVEIYQELGAGESVGYTIINRSMYCFKEKKYDCALENALQALEYGKQLGNLLMQEGAYEVLAESYYQKGKYNEAYTALAEHMKFKDSILNENNIKQLTTMELTYEFDKQKITDSIEFAKKEEISKLELGKKEAELSKTTFQNILLWGGLGFVLLASLIIISRIRAVNQMKHDLVSSNLERTLLREKQIMIDLQLKEKQLTSKSLNLIQKNESLTELKQKLSELNIDDETYEQHKRELQSTINYSFSLDKDWENFQLHFEQVHEGFFDKLKDSYPELTENQLRLCALIRLKLNIKEAASILNLSPNSVRIARTRLRKKLNINREDSLENLLASL